MSKVCYKYVAFFNLTATYGTIKGPKSTADNKTILSLIIEFLPSQIVQTHWEFCPQFASYVYFKNVAFSNLTATYGTKSRGDNKTTQF